MGSRASTDNDHPCALGQQRLSSSEPQSAHLRNGSGQELPQGLHVTRAWCLADIQGTRVVRHALSHTKDVRTHANTRIVGARPG